VGHKAAMDAVAKKIIRSPRRESNPDRSLVPIPTELSRVL